MTEKLTADHDLGNFVAARIYEDYERERASAAQGSMQEVAARIRANALLMSAAFGTSIQAGRLVPTVKALAARYADHPDYREEWRP